MRPVVKENLLAVQKKLSELSEWTPASIQAAINETAEDLGVGMGKIGMPLRVAVTGGGNSPSLDVTLNLLSRGKVEQRINKAVEFISNRENS